MAASNSNWLGDHRISGRLLLPGAAVLEIFAAAGRTILECELLRLKEFTMHRPLVIPEHGRGEARWQVIGKKIDGGVDLELHAASPAESGASNWQRVATATAVSAPALPVAPEVPESDCRKIGPD